MKQEQFNIVELDVRAYLRNKNDPFHIIMDAVKKLDKDDMFILHATIKPSPLITLLKMKGFVSKTERKAQDHWVVTLVRKENRQWLHEEVHTTASPAEEEIDADHGTRTENSDPQIIQLDNRGLEPPKPMVRTLSALERSHPGDEIWIHNDRVPVFLMEELTNLGYSYTVEEQADGTAKVKISKR
ncbi:DUF2249 domain-containing protein [Paenibacillus jiagnxiensis]|uniref:DUF2249 domain-containing protein n=1 Tax=Paenibacillus jiagnxiensis TaxID=3228926 RepID=UPI0033B8B11B